MENRCPIRFRPMVAALAAAVVFLFLPPARALTLQEAAEAVLRNSPDLSAAEAEVSRAESARRLERAAYWPGLAAGASYTRSDDPVFAFGTLLSQSRFTAQDFQIDRLNSPSALDDILADASLQVRLWDPSRGKAVKAARSDRLAAESARDAVRQGLIFRTLETFDGLLLARRRTEILDERIAESEDEIREADRLKAQGLVLGSDYHLARSILGQLRQQRVQSQAERRGFERALNILMGREEDSPLEVSGDLSLKRPWPSPENLRPGLNPEVGAARRREEAARLRWEGESRSLWPSLQGFSRVEQHSYRLESGAWDYTAGARLSLPLGDPSYRARIALRSAGWAEAQAGIRSAEDQTRLEWAKQDEAYRALSEQKDLALQTLDEARQALDQFRRLYRSGRQSVADVLQGELALAQAASGVEQCDYDLRIAYARLLLAGGTLRIVPEDPQ